MRKVLSLIAVALVLVISQRAEAWNGKGHMMVAGVAYSKLKPEIRTREDRIAEVAKPILELLDRSGGVETPDRRS